MNVKEKFFDAKIQTTMMEKVRPLLATLNDDNAKDLVEDFWRKASHYFGIIYGLDAALESDEIADEPASDISLKETRAVLEEGNKLEIAIQNAAIMKKVKSLFRECAIPIGIKSDMVKHAFVRPRGYAGDYGIIEIIYDNVISSRKIGYSGDRVLLTDDYAKAVRSRKDKMKDILTDYIKSETKGDLNIMNIACGSCREIKEMFAENTFDASRKISFTLVDQDQEALDFSMNVLKNSPSNVNYQCRQTSIYDYVKSPDLFREELKGKDLVYTIGLADYLPAGSLKALITFLFSLLKPGGKLIIAHKDSKNYSPLTPDWWCDWTFHLRDEAETVNLVKTSGIKDFNLDVIRETITNIIFFLVIEKK